MEKRLCGREQEYGASFSGPYIKIPQLSTSETLRDFDNLRSDLMKAIIDCIRRYSGVPYYNHYNGGHCWLANGSLIYIDLLVFLEVASAEYRAGSLDGILQEKASEKLINEAVQLIKVYRNLDQLQLYKNNVGPRSVNDLFQEVSYASHHNYSYVTDKRPEVFFLFKSFIPAALPLTGNGHVCRQQSGRVAYALSQRAPHITVDESFNTREDAGPRPIINNRDESLMDNSLSLSRLHIISRDATRCEFQTWLVDSITHLVLRLAEEGFAWQAPFLPDPVREMQNINFCAEANLDYEIEYYHGWKRKKMKLLEYNKLFLDAARQLSPLSEEEKNILEEWERVLELLKAKAFDKLVGELDWVTKLAMLKNQMKKYGYELNEEAWRIDRMYHNISSDPKESIFARLDDLGYIRHLVSKMDIENAVLVAPATRAQSRGDFIKKCWEHQKLKENILTMNWDKAVLSKNIFPSQHAYFGEPLDPFSTQSSSLEQVYKILAL